MINKILPIILAFLFSSNLFAELVEYEFDINTKKVNFTGKEVEALAIENSIPAPTIEANVGDVLKVTFHNKMDVSSSVHWHGILLPNDQDGIPFLNTQPIMPHSSFTFEYPITHHGTYWYHSHTGLQEQRGIYGALVFHPKKELYKANKDRVVILSDWTNESPDNILRNLKREDDYYALKKDSVQSWDKVIQNGTQAIKNRINGSLTRMGPMDISDVAYDAFLTNGQISSKLNGVRNGEIIRLRIINASASSYQYIEFAGGKMTIIAADGGDVKPKTVDRLKIAIAETYDVLVNIPNNNKSYEFRATSEDASGFSSLWLGDGNKVHAKKIEKPNLFLADHSSHNMKDMDHSQMKDMDHSQMKDMDHSQMKDSKPIKISNINTMNEYDGLRSVKNTSFNKDRPNRKVNLNLTGNMENYIWSFNRKTLSEADRILIKKGETVQFILTNKTMMHHPIHLHGHFFRVLNGEGSHSPLKHTVNVPPMQTVVIEFAANEEKDWFFHCHNLYHMKAGMARVVRYEDNFDKEKGERFDEYVKNNFNPWYSFGEVSTQSNMVNGKLWAENNKNELKLEFDYDYDKDYEIEAIYEWRLNRFLGFYVGGKLEREERIKLSENNIIAGLHYVLPLLIESDLRVDSDGDLRFGLSSELQLMDRLEFEWAWNTDNEYRFELAHEINKQIDLVTNFDSDISLGIGINIKF